MNSQDRIQLVRIAHRNPELRGTLVPLLRGASSSKRAFIRWSELYDRLDHSWVRAVDRVLKSSGINRDLSRLMQRSKRGDATWDEVEALEKKYGASWKTLALAMIHEYGDSFERRGDWVNPAESLPKDLRKLLR